VQRLGQASTSERRQLTVVFTDLVDSTRLATSLDPEDYHDVLDRYQHRVAEAVDAHGGTVTQFQGDGAIAYFGWPHATDTATRDALTAGLAIIDAVAGLPKLAARVGIHTGVVVVAPASAGGVLRPADIFGDAPGLAARLQSVAGAGEVVISDATAALASGWFVLEPLGPQTLKGFEAPIEAFRVVAPTGIRSRLDAGHLSTFVGRRAELDTLQSHWDGAHLGPTRTVAVVGDPGIGKSRLVREFATALEDAARFVITCFERDSLSPLQPFTSVMGSLPSSTGTAREWVTHQVQSGPVVLVVEDVHWADPSTMDVIDQLMETPGPLLLLLTSRVELRDYSHRLAATIRMGALGPDDAASVVDAIATDSPIGPDVRDRLVQRAGGVPLFLEELTRSAGTTAGRGPVRASNLPTSLGEIVTARLDTLSDAKRAAQQAAVIGTEFDVTTLTAVSGFSDAEVSDYLTDLVAHGLIEPLSGDHAHGFRFRHAIMQEAAYESLLRRDRRVIHARVADVLLRSPDDVRPRPEIVAAHLSSAGRPIEAIASWERAARRAGRLGLVKESAGHLTRAASCLDDLPPGDERDALEMSIRIHLGQFQGAIDQSAPQVGDNLQRGLNLAIQRGDRFAQIEAYLTLSAHYQALADYPAIHRSLDGALEAATQQSVEWAVPTIGLMRGAVLVWQGELAAGQRFIAEGLATMGVSLDEAPSEPGASLPGLVIDVVVGAYVLYAVAECLAGRTDNARRLGQWASDLANRNDALHAQCLAWTTRAIIHQIVGEEDSVRALAGQALSTPEDRTTTEFRSWARLLLAWADGERAPLAARQAPPALFMRPYLLLLDAQRTDDPDLARRLLEEALAIARATGERFCEAEILRQHAGCLAASGDREGAQRSRHEAIEVAHSQGALRLADRARDGTER
jgi:class 3 adenylate cyclase/tetratricopeptide (TPR) repeat protein